MNFYKNQLNKAKEANIEVTALFIAYTMEYHLNNTCDPGSDDEIIIEYNDDQFEQLCYLAEEAYLKSEESDIDKICYATTMCFVKAQFKTTFSKWDILELASSL